MSTPRSAAHRGVDDSTSGLVAAGTTAFAGFTLSLVALFQVLQGIAAVSTNELYVTGVNYVYELDLTTWGWVHLVIGVLGFATGLGILAGQSWGRIAGIAFASLSAVINFAFLPYYPLWSIVILAFNALVIWALCTQLSRDSA